MWEGLDEIAWAALEHHYGDADDVPGLLRRCAGPEDDAVDAAYDLLNNLFHQGGWICPAATAALPFLLRLAAAPDTALPTRRVTLELVRSLAEEAGSVTGRWLDPEWPTAWDRALPDVLALLADPVAEIRRDAAHILGLADGPAGLVLPALLRALAAETDPVTRLDLLLALGRAAGRAPAQASAAEALDLLRGRLDDPEPQTRLAAVHALAPTDPELPARRLDQLLEAVRDPSVDLWRGTSSVTTGPPGVHRWTGALLDGPSTTFALGLLRDHPDPEQREGALAVAGGLLSRRRSSGTALLPAIAARLDDPAPDVRFLAVELLACLGPAAAAHADEVAALLDDRVARAPRRQEQVAEAAVWALARMNDPRCLPGLVEAVAAERAGSWNWISGHYPVSDWHYAVLPGLHEALGPLADHARELLPAITARLDAAAPDDPAVGRLCEVLAQWGPASAAMVPRLIALLDHDRSWAAAAQALAAIGPAGAGARDALLARTGTGTTWPELAAWASWKVGGEPGPLLEVFGHLADARRVPHPALRMISELGPLAAPYADPLRALTAVDDPWTSAEAAHALWTATGDTDTAVPALTAAVRVLPHGRLLPVAFPAVRHLTRIGWPARPAAHLLGGLLPLDQRLRTSGGWRGFADDEAIRAAITDLLTACDLPLPA
ncbi:hypothetical protein ACWEQL_00975 [Kitasatospora sp. NPDC004240]